jgi:hypothetical protein
MRKQANYIHFDGMDLAGKSSAGENFIASFGGDWDIRRNRITLENPIHNFADNLRREEVYDAEVLGNLYFVALMADIRNFTWPTKDTIQDSTLILRSLAYHTVRRTPKLPEMIIDLFQVHPQFDFSFVFTANIETRIERLKKRIIESPWDISAEDMMVIKKPEMFMAMDNCLVNMAQLHFKSKVIDTSFLSPKDVIDILLGYVSF